VVSNCVCVWHSRAVGAGTEQSTCSGVPADEYGGGCSSCLEYTVQQLLVSAIRAVLLCSAFKGPKLWHPLQLRRSMYHPPAALPECRPATPTRLCSTEAEAPKVNVTCRLCSGHKPGRP